MCETKLPQPRDELPARQVHLDFHTSEHIKGVGTQFSKEDFQQALREGHVSSITVFAKCHHGYCYYPTKVGTMHPQLDFDLLGAMLDAAHEIGVKAPVYITAGWSALDAQRHPEWWSRRANGACSPVEGFDPNAAPGQPKPEASWMNLCLNDGSYARHIYALTQEICERYSQLDGLFYDICFFEESCWCDECRAGMRAMGLCPESEADAKRYFIEMHQRFMENCRRIVAQTHPDAGVFFNGGAEIGKPEYHALQTHFELEDLPTAWGGYDKLPLRAKYFAKTGKQYLGMTGKFHLAWGEFGGFKTPQALRYEVAAMMAFGARCSVGDHLHPLGKMDPETYRLIGSAYRYAERIEPYCFGLEPVPGLGLYLSRSMEANEGTAKALLDAHMEFDVILPGAPLAPYAAVLVPEGAVLNGEEAARLRSYAEAGGALLVMGDSIQQEDGPLAEIGCRVPGPADTDVDYLQVRAPALGELPRSPFLMYCPAMRVEPRPGACEILADVAVPYFSRTYGHYCGHKNTPYDPAAPRRPAAVQNGNVVYAAHPLGTIYKRFGCEYHRRYFEALLKRVCPRPVVRVELPSAGRVSFGRQPKRARYCLHLLYAAPQRRGAADVIEDIVPQYDTGVELRIPEQVTRVTAFPQQEELHFVQQEGVLRLRVPKFTMHTVLALDYAAPQAAAR